MTQKIKINLWVISTLILYSISPMYAQHERFNKNALYGSFGVSKFFTVTAFYERILTQKKGPSTFLKVGNGTYGGYAESGKYILLHYGILTGIKKHHLEISAGVNHFYSEKDNRSQSNTPFSGTIGWRLQKPGKHFVLRSGISWPEGLYFGLGRSF